MSITVEIFSKIRIATMRGQISHIFKCNYNGEDAVGIMLRSEFRLYKLSSLGYDSFKDDIIMRNWNIGIDSKRVEEVSTDKNNYIVNTLINLSNYGYNKVEITDNSVNFIKAI